MIILCGSAISFIEKKLLSENNPLYGRATGIYKMMEMSFYDAVKFFPDYSEYKNNENYIIVEYKFKRLVNEAEKNKNLKLITADDVVNIK